MDNINIDSLVSVLIQMKTTSGKFITPYGWDRIVYKSDTKQIVVRYPDGTREFYALVDQSPVLQKAIYGIMIAGDFTVSETESIIESAGINLIRIPLFWSNATSNKIIDSFLQDGYNVQINFNYKPTGTTVGFPTDTTAIRAAAERFFQYYLPYKNQIPFVAVENEWDNEKYHGSNIIPYFSELDIVTEVGHKYGFKIADAGITSTAIRRWTYTQLDSEEQSDWELKYFVGKNMSNFKPLIDKVNLYIDNVKNIPIDFPNIHWYNINQCYNGFEVCSEKYSDLLSHYSFVSNEFGIIVNDVSVDKLNLFKQTAVELKDNIYNIAYSDAKNAGNAEALTTEMIDYLPQI